MGIISSNTIQVGRRLIKTFGEGQNLKKVVTETLEDGNILTRVFNNEGKQLTERLKKVGNMEEVGDKLVKTTTKVVKDEEGVITKQVRDRVYDKKLVEEQLADMEKVKEFKRKSELFTGLNAEEEAELAKLLKSISDRHPALGERVETYAESGNLIKKILRSFKSNIQTTTDSMCKLRDYREYIHSDSSRVRIGAVEYNGKGLPYPARRNVIETDNGYISLYNMSLRDMRRLWQKFRPGNKYSFVRSLTSLDEPVKGDRITKLDKFL